MKIKDIWYVEINQDYTNVETKYYTVATDVTNDDAYLIAAAPEMYNVLKSIIASAPLTGLSLALEKDIQNATHIINSIEKDYDPSPCCYQHSVGAIGSKEPCPNIAENE